MAVTTVTGAVSAAGAFNADWTLGAGANNVVAVQTADGDTSYIVSATAGHKQSYVFANAPASNILILAVRVVFNCSAPAVGSGTLSGFYCQSGGLPIQKATVTITSNAYTNYATGSIGNPYASGGPWTVTDFNNADVGIELTSLDAGSVRCTYLVSEMDYIYPAGGLVFLLLTVGPLIAVTLADMPSIARAVEQQTRHRLHPDGYAEAYQELKDYRFPRYFDLRR